MTLIQFIIQTLLEWVRDILGEIVSRRAGESFAQWRKRKQRRKPRRK
jgi:hypothetical protein